MSIQVTLKPSYEVPLIGVIGATAQGGIVSNKVNIPFRINGVIVVFADDHINNVDHYLLEDDVDAVSVVAISAGRNILSSISQTPYLIGHSMIKHVKVIREYPEGDVYLKVHVVNNNAYAVQVNVTFIIEEL